MCTKISLSMSKSFCYYTQKTKKEKQPKLFLLFGSESGARSHDLRIMNPTL